MTPSIWRWIYLATTVGPVAGPILSYSMIIFGIFLLAIVFLKAYKNFVIGQNSIEIMEIGRETIRRGSTLIISSSHKLMPCKEAMYQPLNKMDAEENSNENLPDFKIRRSELSQSLDELKGVFKKSEFVKTNFETETESLIRSDNTFIKSELRRCSVLNLRDSYYF